MFSIKLYAWEHAFLRRVLLVRNEEELKMLKKIAFSPARLGRSDPDDAINLPGGRQRGRAMRAGRAEVDAHDPDVVRHPGPSGRSVRHRAGSRGE